MKRQKKWSFTVVLLIIGVMLAIQFQTIKNPEVRDTRDSWQLRSDLSKEQDNHAKLLKELRIAEEKLSQYKSNHKTKQTEELKLTLEELKKEAGLTPIKGPGLTLSIEPVADGLLGNESPTQLSPDLLYMLINELNRHGAIGIAISEQRLINTSAIREINRVTKVDGVPINQYPLEIKVATADLATAEKLYNKMNASPSAEFLFLDNLQMVLTKPSHKIAIPAFTNQIDMGNIKPVKSGEKED